MYFGHSVPAVEALEADLVPKLLPLGLGDDLGRVPVLLGEYPGALPRVKVRPAGA